MYRISVDARLCKPECGLCSAFCPAGVLAPAPDQRPLIVHPEACTNCQLCELHCPDFAIEVHCLNL